MAITSEKKGYILTYDAQCARDDWESYGGCHCFLGHAPCRSCTHEGHPYSQIEDDECWELDIEEEEMSRDQIVDKSQQKFKAGDRVKCITKAYNIPQVGEVLTFLDWRVSGSFNVKENNFTYWPEHFELAAEAPPVPYEFKIGDKVKIRKDSKYYGISDSNPADVVGVITDFDGDIDVRWPKVGVNNYGTEDLELVIEEKDFTTTKQSGTIAPETKVKGFEVGKHYKCIDSAGNCYIKTGAWYKVEQIMSRGKLEIIGSKGTSWPYKSELFDPIAREDQVLGYTVDKLIDNPIFKGQNNLCSEIKLPESTRWSELADHRHQDTTFSVTKSRDSSVRSEVLVWDSTQLAFKINVNQQEESNMSNRRVVNVQLVDDDKGLDVQFALVHDFGDRMTEDTNDVMIQELIMEGEVADLIAVHNQIRTEQVNLEIQDRTGQTVNLRPVKLKQLRWIIK